MAKRSQKKPTPETSSDWKWGAILVAAVLAAYFPVAFSGYIWDDVTVVFGNPVIIGPLGLKEIWTTHAADICPLTLTTFWLEYQLWGSVPFPYHIVNLLQHATSAVLLWFVLRRLQIPGAWLGAAFWALHPVEVESVAWISEMKNTQSGVFYLLTILFYLKSLTPGPAATRHYALTLLFAAMAMASKSSTVVLPVVLGLAAWWVQRRWDWRNLIKLAPLFLFSLAAGLVSLWTQKAHLQMFDDPQIVRPWPERFAEAGYAIWFYLGKLIWPHPLVTIYPRPHVDPAQILSWFPTLAVIALLAVLWLKRNTAARPLFFTFTYFVIALLPILGLLDNTIFVYALVFDHFQYLASMGPLALAGAALYRLKNYASPRNIAALQTVLLLLLGLTTLRQTFAYITEEHLWKNTLAFYPDNGAAHYSLGVVHEQQKREEAAVEQFRAALKNSPNSAVVRNSLGRALANIGHTDEAIQLLFASLQTNPENATLHNNLGKVYLQTGRIDEALAQFRQSLALEPDKAEGHYSLGTGLAKKGELDASITEFRRAIELNPRDSMSRNNLGVQLLRKGEVIEAIGQFQQALLINPDDASARGNLEQAERIERRNLSR